jgi:hypothetical protein
MLANAVSVLPDDVARVADVALTPASATSTLEEELDIFLLFELAVAIAFAASRRA